MTSPGIVRGSSPGEMIGPYKLLELIGEGGFGYVWRAERREPFVQRVALKVIKPGMDSRGVLARFDQERQALAVMDHPNVARVVDGGLTSPEQGQRPYFVMEYVKGEPITTYCDRNRLSLRERLKLFIPVCEAVQHAHHKGIIHRDIKPSNVLVTVVEGRAAAKVIDFGVAKAMSHTLTEHSILTEHGQLIGTPEYMSPEQAEMGGTDIDTRTDVYSLGVLLYELLTGRLPFESATLRAAALDEVRRIIREQEPPKPSTRLTTLSATEAHDIASRRQSDTDELAKTLRRELDWIPLKAMRKDRARRYTTPGAIAEDIQRYLDDKPIEAAPESRAYLLKKFVRRYRGGIVAASAVAAALLLGVVVSLAFMTKAELRRIEAEEATREAQRQTELAALHLAEVQREKEKADRVAEAVSLLARAQAAQSSSDRDEEWESYREFVDRMKAGLLADAPEADLAIRQAFSAAAMQSTEAQKRSDAVQVMMQAVENAKAAYGSQSDTTIRIIHQAMYTASAAGEFDLAASWGSERLRLLQAIHGDDHAELVDAMSDLAENYVHRSESVRAADLFRGAMDMGLRVPDQAQHAFDRAARELSSLLGTGGAIDDSLRITIERVDFWRERLPGYSVLILMIAADEYEAGGHLTQAAECLRRLIEVREVSTAPDNWRLHSAKFQLGRVLMRQQRFAEAEPLMITSAPKLRAFPDTQRDHEHNRVVEAYEGVVKLYEQWNAAEPEATRQSKAESWRQALAEVVAEEQELYRKGVERDKLRKQSRELNRSAWAVVRFPATTPDRDSAAMIEKALRDARAAVDIAVSSSDRLDSLNTVGVAQFRAGLYAEAVQTLQAVESEYTKSGRGEDTVNMVFIAMAQRRLGLHADAARTRAQYEARRARHERLRIGDEYSAWHAEFLAEFGLSE
jgi:serine/threonine protein kinase/tetratricopeptide (TPR) repeat protein